MRTIVAGSRGFHDWQLLCATLNPLSITVVISGGARGADRLGERWARLRQIPIEQFPAHWNLYRRRAGFQRNEQMAQVAEQLVAFWDGESPGTRHMIKTAERFELAIIVI